MAVVSRQDHFREPPQTLSSFSALCRLLCHDRTTSSVTSLSSSSCSSRSSAATIAHNNRTEKLIEYTTYLQALPYSDRSEDSSFSGVERPFLGLHSSSCLAPSRPASPDSGFAVGIEVKRSSNGDFPLLQKKSLNFCFLQRDSDFQYVQKYPID